MKKFFSMVCACLLALSAQATDIKKYDALYENLPFQMEKETSHAGFSRDEYRYVDDFRPDRYRVERVDALRPAGGGAFPVMRYVDNNRCAGVACADSRTFVMGFPFEALESDVQRDRLMADILGFLLGGKSGGDD